MEHHRHRSDGVKWLKRRFKVEGTARRYKQDDKNPTGARPTGFYLDCQFDSL